MTVDRTPRSLETREARERPKVWQPAATLPTPEPMAGYEMRWIRVNVTAGGDHDARNISSKTREGWEPVSIEDQPQFRLMLDPDSRFKDNIEVGGLLLCKIPTEFVEQRKAYYAQRVSEQMESVDNSFMRENDPRMPLFRDKRSKTSFGTGR